MTQHCGNLSPTQSSKILNDSHATQFDLYLNLVDLLMYSPMDLIMQGNIKHNRD